MNRVIEKEKGEFLLKVGIRLFLATDNVALC